MDQREIAIIERESTQELERWIAHWRSRHREYQRLARSGGADASIYRRAAQNSAKLAHCYERALQARRA